MVNVGSIPITKTRSLFEECSYLEIKMVKDLKENP